MYCFQFVEWYLSNRKKTLRLQREEKRNSIHNREKWLEILSVVLMDVSKDFILMDDPTSSLDFLN